MLDLDEKQGPSAIRRRIERYDHTFVLPDAEHADEDFEALAWLTTEIEKLGRGSPMRAYNWGTHRDTKFIVFDVHGLVDEGSERAWSVLTAHQAAESVLSHVLSYRNSLNCTADLVWRRDAEIDRLKDSVKLSVRLCFEPTLVQVAKGVWVEARLAQADPDGFWGRYNG